MVNLSACRALHPYLLQRLDAPRYFVSVIAHCGTAFKAAQFAAMALCNLAHTEPHRAQIRGEGGLPVLVGMLMSLDYYNRKFAMAALANMALSPEPMDVSIFCSAGLLKRVIGLAYSHEEEIEYEVAWSQCNHRVGASV